MLKRIIAMLLAIVMLVGNVPVQAFAAEDQPQATEACITEGCTFGAGHTGECSTFVACGKDGCTYAEGHAGDCSTYVAPKVEAAADAAVYVTVSDRGELGMAYEEVTVSDINQDGKLSVDEALYAAHTACGKGYASEKGTVTKLWDVETTNVSFFVNHEPVSADVSTDTVRGGDYLVASVDQDTVNDYDKYSRFHVLEKSADGGKEFILTLVDNEGTALAGMEIGLSNGDGSTTMLGQFTDENGQVSLTLDQEGIYCVTAKGTLVEQSIDLETGEFTSIETPIIAPVCMVTVSGNVEAEAYTAESPVAGYAVPAKIRSTRNTESDHSVTVGFTVVDCLEHNVERMRKELTVTPGLALEYFPDGQYGGSVGLTTEVGGNDVTPIDVLVAAHLDAYGDAFASNPGDYIEGFDYAIKMFGEQSEITWSANGIMPYLPAEDAANTAGYDLGYAINQYIVQNGDEICFYRMSFYATPANVYASFDQVETEVKTGEELTLRLGYCATMEYYDSTFPAANAEIFYLNEDGTLGDSTSLTTNENGEVTVTFGEAGTCYLTCRGEVEYADMMGNPTSALSPAYIKINVKNAPVAVESVTLDKAEATLEVGETVTLSATVNPDNATDKTVTWSTSNAAVAQVVDGKITAIAVGNVTITAKAGEKTASCTVTVNAPAPELYEIETGIATVNQNWMEATTIRLDADVVSHTRTEGTNEFTVIVKEQKNSIALELDLLTYKQNQVVVWNPTVSLNGTVTGTVTAAESGVAGTNGLNGAWPAIWSGGSVAPVWNNGRADVTVELAMGSNVNTYVLHLEVEGSGDSGEKPAELYEIETGIATVNQNWMEATTIRLDADVVSHTRTEGTNEFTVIVKEQKNSIALELDLLTYKQNQVVVWNPTVSLNGTVTGTVTAAESGVAGTNGLNGAWPAIWSGGSVAPVWNNGRADVTVELAMGSNVNTYVLHLVIEGNEGPTEVAVESVTLNKSEVTLEIGGTETLTATVSPEDATDKTVTWTSDNAAVVTVADGVVTAVSAGTATITAKAGEKTATCTVTVNAPAPELYEIQTGVATVEQNFLKATAIRFGMDVVSCTVDRDNANKFTLLLAADTDKTESFPLELDLLAYDKNAYSQKQSIQVNGYTQKGTFTAAENGTTGAWPGSWTGGSVKPSWSEDGKAVVTINVKQGSIAIQYMFNLIIGVPISDLTLNQNAMGMAVGQTATLTANISPSNSVDRDVVWTTSDAGVVKVENGQLTALKTGTATITATVGNKQAICEVTVVADISTKILTKDKAVLEDGQKFQEAYITELDVVGANVAFHKIVQSALTEMQIYVILDENTPDDTAVVLDFTTGALVSPNITKVTGIDPAVVKLVNGNASYTVEAINYNNNPSHKYTFILRNSNAVPALKQNILPEKSVDLLLQETYDVNLEEIFEDADGDELEYTVTYGDETTQIDAAYTCEAWTAGEHSYIFKATDGFQESAAYTVKLNVGESEEVYQATVKVPDAITPSFYITRGFEADGTDKLGGELTAVKGESKDGWTSYSVSVPGSISWISVRGVADTIDWGGMAFAVEKDAVITLRQVNAIISSKIVVDNVESYPNEEQALFKVEYTDGVGNRFAVNGGSFNDQYGFLGYRFLLVAADNSQIYTYYAEPLGDVAKNYSTNVGITKTITTDSAETVTTTLPLGTQSAFAITAPVDAKVQMFTQSGGNYYGAVEIPAFDTKENGDGTKTVTFNGVSRVSSYRVSREGKITKAGYVDGDSVTVTWDDNDPAPSYRRAYDLNENGYYLRADDSIVVNVNYRNNLLLDVGQTHPLRSYRIWQIINNDTQNVMIEPDFHINVLSGGDVIRVSEYPDYHGNGTGNRMDITALKTGIAILEVTYDAIAIMEREPGDGEINGISGLTFNACDPDRTALIVVQVGEVKSDVDFGILNNGGNAWDAEHDTLYFLGDQGQIEFNPTVGSGSIDEVSVSNNKGASWTVLTGSSGTYTATIVPGNNIIRIIKEDGAVSYQLVRGDKISYTVEERLDVEGADGDGILEAGEPVYIDFSGQHNPFGKMAGIYNPWNWHTRYDFEGTTLKGSAGMYNYAHYSRVFLTIPEDAKSGDVLTLTNGYTELGTAFGSGGGGHRNAGDVVPPSMDAPDSVPGSFNIFPDITITVGGDNSEAQITLDPETLTMTVGETAKLTATVDPADTEITWSSSDNSVAMVSNGTVTAYKAGTATITAKAGTAEATCTVTVEPGLTFDLDETEIVGYVTVSFVDNGVRKDGELNSIDQKFKNPLGNIVEATRVPFKAYDTIAAVTLRLLDALDMTSLHSGNADSNFYLSKIGNFTVGETTYESLGEFDAGSGSGWMVTWNTGDEKGDWFINKGASEFHVNNGDVIKWQYTCQLGADIGDTYSKECVDNVIKLISDIGDVTLESEAAINAAKEAYDQLAPVQQAAVTNYDKLTAAIAALNALKASEEDKTAAKEVIDLIEAIPELKQENKDTLQTAVNAAKAAWDELTDAQKALVSNLKELEDAEDYLALLNRVPANIADIYTATGNQLAGKALTTGSINGEWAALGLARSGRAVAVDYYEKVEEFVDDAVKSVLTETGKGNRLHSVKSTENARVILALTAIGKDVTDVNGHNLLAGLNEMSYVTKQGINGAFYTLIALDSHDYTPTGDVTREKLIDVILDAQLSDGGWSLSNASDVDMTAMAIQALAPYYESDASVKAAVDKALTWLSDAQHNDGSFGSVDGPNAESIAQVIVALTALGIDPDTDSRFIKTGITPIQALADFYARNGQFEHTAGTGADDMATEQGYYALVSYFRFLDNKTSLYDMSDVVLVKDVEDLIDAIGEVTRDSKAAIENAREAYEALDDTLKSRVNNLAKLEEAEKAYDQLMVKEVMDKIDAIGQVTLDSEQAIQEAEEAYEVLTDTQKEAVTNYSKLTEAQRAWADLVSTEADKAEAAKVKALIDAIGDVTLDSEAQIREAQEAYEALTDVQKPYVDNLETLKTAEATLTDLKNQKAADDVEALIDNIGTVELTTACENAINAARRAYNALTTIQKGKVDEEHLKALTDAENTLAALKDQAAADAVKQKIAAIGTPVTQGSESKIKTARNAYDALTAAQKALVSNYQTLVKAEEALDTLKSTVSVTFSLLGCYKHGSGETTVHTLAGGNLQTWIAAKTYKVKPGATVKDLFEQALTAAGLTWKNPTGNYVESITRNGVTIGEFTNGTNSGWMYTLNGKHPGLGVNQQTLVNGDKVVFHYTDDYTKEEGNPSGSTNGTTTGTTSGTVSGSTNYITTTTTTVNTETAESVDRLIEDIGEEITLDSAAKIKAARAAYDKLTEAQKKLVKKYDVLVAAEKKLAELKGVSFVDVYAETGDYIQGLGTPGVGAVGGEWMVIGLARSGRTVPTGYYDHVLNYVRENINNEERLHSAKSSDNSRVILALTAIGKDVTNVDGHDLLKGLNSMDYIQKQGINGPIWALIAFDSGNYPVPEGDVSREKLIDVILEAQLDDGGWALSGERSDPDMTGMAIQALVPYMDSRVDVKKAVEEAIWTLSEMQNDNGSFTSVDGPNSESIAQVIVALAALGIDADTDARFVKNGISALDALLTYYIPGGGFRHVLDGNLDGMATEQAYYALVAYNRMKQSQNFLYDMTDVIDRGGDVVVEETTEPTEMPTEPAVEEDEDNGNAVVIWTGVMTLCAGAIVVLLLNRKKLFGKFL